MLYEVITGLAVALWGDNVVIGETFVTVPTVVAAGDHVIDFLPLGLAYVANPEVTGQLVDAHTPGITEAGGVDLRQSRRGAGVAS